MTARDILMVARPSKNGGTISHRNFLFKVKAWTEQNKKQSLELTHSCMIVLRNIFWSPSHWNMRLPEEREMTAETLTGTHNYY